MSDSKMNQDTALEVYKQRYETFRHLDRLRWQLIQLAVAIFTATALVVRVTTGGIEWWFTLALSVSLMALSGSMLKVSQGLRHNQSVLSEAAALVGDHSIPNVQNVWQSVFHWIALAIGVAGVAFLVPTATNFCEVF